MGNFSNIFGKNETRSPPPEHAVFVCFSYGQTDLQPIFHLEDKLERAISQAGAGEYDGNELAADGRDGILYIYGSDGDKLFKIIKPILELTPFMKGATTIIRYGSPGEDTIEKRIILGS